MNFKTHYSNTPESLKVKFLDAIILENKKLQQAFFNFTNEETNAGEGLSFSDFLEITKRKQEIYLKDFEQVDPENPDWDSYNPPYSGYIEEWEQYQQATEQEFEQLFKNCRSDAVDKIIGQQLDEMLAMLIAMYEATQDAVIIDETDTFDDVNELLLTYHQEMMGDLIGKIKLSAISEGNIKDVFQLFTAYADEEYPGNPHFPRHFEPLLKALANKSGHTDQLLSIIDKANLERSAMPELVLLLNKNAGNADEWLQHAKNFYLSNIEVATELLTHYFKHDKSAFLKTARELFALDKYHWSEFLKDFVSLELDKALYFDVFYELTVHCREIGYYEKIRDLLNENALKALLNEIDYHKTFVVEILEMEERYDEIRKIVERNPDSWDYADLISPILSVFPEFCFNHIKSKAVKTIDNERGRSTYVRVASWLQLADKIPGFKAENRILAQRLYNHKPNLPALKDELRKAGLV